DVSCIDPIKRNPDRFWERDDKNRLVVKQDELEKFCQENPRLVRRLREQLNYDTPNQIVQFLEANRDVPTRFKRAGPDRKESELEEPRKQFPILPPVKPRAVPGEPAWPDPNSDVLTGEAVD